MSAVKAAAHRLVARLVAMILRPGATTDPANAALWERRGYHITPVHFYSPIPDSREIAARTPKSSDLPGIDLRVSEQLRLLADDLAPFAAEVVDPPAVDPSWPVFSLDNDAFAGIDPYVYHGIVRRFRPRNVIEVGSGHSTLVGAAAALRVGARYLVVDPWPNPLVAGGLGDVEIVARRVEDVPLATFERLARDDVLFIDSTHVVRTSGDVAYLFLEVLPRLAPGVLVHVHDVFLPDDYPRHWLLEHRRFWTEQYMLQAHLTHNERVEVLAANHYLATRHPDAVRRAFPGASSWDGGSFWMRTR